MACGIERAAHAGDVAGGAGRGLVVTGEHALDLVALVGAQDLRVTLERHSFAPFDLQHLDLEAEALRHVDPQMRELTEAGGEDPVARRERVGERGFPRAGAGGREDEHLARAGLEDFLQVAEDARRKLRKLRGAVILHGHDHGALHAVGHVGRTRYEQEISSRHAALHHLAPIGVTYGPRTLPLSRLMHATAARAGRQLHSAYGSCRYLLMMDSRLR